MACQLEHRAKLQVIRRRPIAMLASVLATVGPLARAQEPASWLDAADATGDWGGGRRWLDEHGVHLDLDYTGESFGAIESSRRAIPPGYRGNIDGMLTLDTALLGLWSGGTLFVYAQNAHGRGVSDQFTALMPVSNLEAPAFTQLSELWYEQQALGEVLLVRVGKQDANRDFAAPRFPGNFIHSSYGVLPTIPMPSFPTPGLGAVLYVDPEPWLSLRTGVYEVAPRLESLGFGSAFRTGVFLIASATVRHPIGIHADGAQYGAGAWYARRDAAEVIPSSSGGFLITDLWLPLARDGGDDRTIQTFARVGWAQRAPDSIHFYAAAGVTYHLGQADDTIGIGAGHVTFSRGTAARDGSESFIEAFYKQRFTPWLALQPDVQVVVTPGGRAAAVCVAGARLKLKL